MVNSSFRHGSRPGWKEPELRKLTEDIKLFKCFSESVFSLYQASVIITVNWRCLDHLLADLRDVGDVHIIHVGLYEWAHKVFKRDYGRTSNRVEIAMDEAVTRQSGDIIRRQYAGTNVSASVKRVNSSRIRAVNTDGGFLVKSGNIITLADLEYLRHEVVPSPSGNLHALQEALQDDGMFAFTRLIRQEL